MIKLVYMFLCGCLVNSYIICGIGKYIIYVYKLYDYKFMLCGRYDEIDEKSM